TLPQEVLKRITQAPAFPPVEPPPNSLKHNRLPGMPPVFTIKTSNPTIYWMGIPIPVLEQGNPRPVRSVLMASSDTMTGHGLFFNPTPWVIVIAAVVGLSVRLWLPFVRSLTKTIAQMTAAAEQIAEERFDVRVDERRSDELGRLGKAINHLTMRLSGFVGG